MDDLKPATIPTSSLGEKPIPGTGTKSYTLTTGGGQQQGAFKRLTNPGFQVISDQTGQQLYWVQRRQRFFKPTQMIMHSAAAMEGLDGPVVAVCKCGKGSGCWRRGALGYALVSEEKGESFDVNAKDDAQCVAWKEAEKLKTGMFGKRTYAFMLPAPSPPSYPDSKGLGLGPGSGSVSEERKVIWERTHDKALGASRWGSKDFRLVDTRPGRAEGEQGVGEKVLGVFVFRQSLFRNLGKEIGRLEFFGDSEGLGDEGERTAMVVLFGILEVIREEEAAAAASSNGGGGGGA
jgi:hypothetical protein